MFRRSFFKSHPEHLVAHLYEHIVYIHLDTLWREKELFTPFDYDIYATTTDGRIELTIESYTDQLTSAIISESIEQLEITFTDEITDIAVRQLEAEYGKELVIVSRNGMVRELCDMQSAQWEAKETRPNSIRQTVLKIGAEIKTETLVVIAVHQHVDNHLRPLYRQIAGVVLNNFLSDLADTYGGFVDSATYQVNDTHELEGVIRFRKGTRFEDLDEFMTSTLRELGDMGAWERLTGILQRVEAVPLPPSNARTFEDTGILMNAEKWRALATPENIKQVIRLFEYRFERY